MFAPLLLAFAAVLPQDAPDEDIPQLKGCRSCKHQGVIDCRKHDKDLLPLEKDVVFCSVAARCQKCEGGLATPCPKCAGGPGTITMDKRVEISRRRLAAEDPCEKIFEREFVRVETKHFIIQIDAHKLRDGKRKLSAHDFAHLLAVEVELAAELFNEHYPKLWNTGGKPRIWYWGRKSDHIQAMRKVLKVSGSGDFRFMSRNPVSTAWTGDTGMEDDALAVAANGVHSSIHLRLGNAFGDTWLGNQKAGWFDAGAAHWYEIELFKRNANYCIDELTVSPNYKNGYWYSAIRKRLAKEKTPLLPRIVNKLTGQLWQDEHALAWSLYDWVARAHPKKLGLILKMLKQKKTTREAFREHLGLSIPAAEAQWREWVSKTYPLKDPKARKKL